nr:DnaJ domain-containing protein [Ipomoea batatas]
MKQLSSSTVIGKKRKVSSSSTQEKSSVVNTTIRNTTPNSILGEPYESRTSERPKFKGKQQLVTGSPNLPSFGKMNNTPRSSLNMTVGSDKAIPLSDITNCSRIRQRKKIKGALEVTVASRLENNVNVSPRNYNTQSYFLENSTTNIPQESNTQAEPADVEETPAQAQARAKANMKLKIESFSNIWSWIKEDNFIRKSKANKAPQARKAKRNYRRGSRFYFGRNRWAKAEGEVVLLRSRGSAASVRRSSIEGSRGKSEGGWQRAKTEASAMLLRSVGRRLREAEGRRKADGRGRRRRGGGATSAVPLRWSVVDCGKAEGGRRKADGSAELLRFFASLGKI